MKQLKIIAAILLIGLIIVSLIKQNGVEETETETKIEIESFEVTIPKMQILGNSVHGEINANRKCFNDFQVYINGPEKPRKLLDDYIQHYKTIIFNHHRGSDTRLNYTLHIEYSKDTFYKQMSTDESYQMKIKSTSVTLKATNVFGIFYAIQHFSESVVFDFETECYKYLEGTERTLVETTTPSLRHRELLIDSGRHFLPVPVIERVLYGMAYSRLNILHWHIGDWQSFPLCLKSVPRACSGAFSSHERYSVADAKYIVNKANSLGIRVIPEIDTPGHARPLCQALDACSASTGSCSTIFDVSKEETFQGIEKIFTELASIFHDKYIHTGGDEVKFSCWNENQKSAEWLTANSMTSTDAYGYFVNRVHQIILKLGRIPIAWDEVYENFGAKTTNTPLDKRVVVQIWRGNKIRPQNVVRKGYKVILSKVIPDAWYLDNLKADWKRVYFRDPIKRYYLKSESNFLGGGVEMWGEKVDSSVIFNTIWPKAAAVAKYLWEGKVVGSSTSVEKQLQYFRCLLLWREIGVAPLSNEIARQGPSGPGSCAI